jgi:hypothetical protein
MFTSGRSIAVRPAGREPRERGIATLRIYNSADFPWGAVYEEAVLGAYKILAQSDPIILVSGGVGKPAQQFQLSAKTGYARHLGLVPPEVQGGYDDTAPGDAFFMRSLRVIRLTKDQIKAAIFAQLIWYAEKQGAGNVALGGKAPTIPTNTKMCHKSLFSESAGNVEAILTPAEPNAVDHGADAPDDVPPRY